MLLALGASAFEGFMAFKGPGAPSHEPQTRTLNPKPEILSSKVEKSKRDNPKP